MRSRAVQMLLDHEGKHSSQWTAPSSITAKVNYAVRIPHEWVKKAEVDSGTKLGPTTDMAATIRALEVEVGKLRQANEILRKASVASPVAPFLRNSRYIW